MERNATLSKLLAAATLVFTMASCGSGEKKDPAGTDTLTTSTEIPENAQTAPATESFKEFDWAGVPQSSAAVGAFPYLTAPSGFFIQDKGGWNESKTGYSEMKDFNKLIMYNGESFYNAEGKTAKLKFSMKDKEADWNQYGFDSSVDRYLLSIGAKPIGKLKLTQAQKKFLNKEDDMSIYNHIVGDPYNDPVRMYALNHPQGKVMFQVFSNSASGEVAVVELAAFQQTIKAPTAAEMKRDLDANGKAILHINFDTDRSTLQPEGQKVVEEILALLKNSTELKLSIEGHTDNSGSSEHNKKLSLDRAATITKFLAAEGIAAGRLASNGFGAERPLVANDSEANMARNRRVELVKK